MSDNFTRSLGDDVFASLSGDKGQGSGIQGIIRGAAERYNLDPRAMLALAHEESSLNPNARNKESTAGGLFQFLDGTWKQYGRGDKFDPAANADAAARMLRENLDRFGGNYDLALAAHHVGPGKARSALSDSSVGDVNISTQNWLKKIKSRMGGDVPESVVAEAPRPKASFAQSEESFGGPLPMADEMAQTKRSWGEFASDTGASILKGAGHFGESMGGLYGLATGDVDPNVVQTGGKALADFAESLKSDFIKNKERLSQQDIDAAEGHFNKFATAAWSNMSDPALFVNFFAEQAINFVPGMAAGRLAKGIIAGLGGASAAAIEAAPLAQKAMLMKRLETAGQIGTGVSVATGAVLQGADAGNSAYQQVMGRPQTEWDANPDYQRLVTTHGIDGAKQQIALQEARAAFAKSAVMSAGLNSVAPAHSIDKILVNGLKNKALTTAGREVVEKAAGQTLTRAAGTGAVKGFLGESASEALDEGYSQYAANEAEAAVNPNKDLYDDVAQNAGLGAAFGPIGAVTGGIEGASRRKSAQELMQLPVKSPVEEAAEKPNSPLSRAAVAAGGDRPYVTEEDIQLEKAHKALNEQVAAIGDRLNDRAIYDAIRSHENLGPQALNDILGAYRVASNFNLDIKQRQAAVERLNNFFQLFDNQPNFTMGANGEAEQGGPLVPAGNRGEGGRRQASDVPTYDVGAPALGYQRRGDTLTDERAKQAAAAEYEQAYQDLVKAEQLGAGDQELMQRQMALRQAEARLQEIQQAIDGNRQLDSAAKRDALLGDVLAALPPGQNPNRAFDRALRNAGFNETQFSEAERAKIAQWQQLSDGFMQQDAEPSRPNEMDAAALGIKEKQAAQAPANPNLAKVDAMLKAGMQRKGDKMFDPRTGKSVKLSPAQIARAKHLERQNDRNRVMPAYQRAIEQRTRELEQLLSDQNHDEAAAVRLARGLSGLKQMVEQLQRGASLDEAIGNVFGQVGSQFANQLKNPNQRKDDAGDAPAAVESAPQPKAPRGGRRLTPLQDERLAQYGDDLQAMAGDAGWAEIGGILIRDENDNPVGRTRYIPRAEWFVSGMLNSPLASEEAVRKALAGDPMYSAEKLHVSKMMDFLDKQYLSDAGNDALETLEEAISEDSDFGLPDYSAETAAVIELEFAQGSVDVPAFLEAIGANDEENDVTENETGAGQAGGASGEGAQASREDGQNAPGTGRAGAQSEGFSLSGQTPEQVEAQERRRVAAERAAEAERIKAEEAEKKAEEEREIRRRNEAASANFQLGQSAIDNLNGQGDIFSQPSRSGDTKPTLDQFKNLPYEVKVGDKLVFENLEYTVTGGADGGVVGEHAVNQYQTSVRVFTGDELHLARYNALHGNEPSKEKPNRQKEPVKTLDEAARNAEREKFKEQLLADVRAGKVALVEGQQKLAEFDKQTKAMREGNAPKQPEQTAVNPKDKNSDERLVERAEAVAKKYDDAGYPDHGKIIRASLKSRQPSRDNVEFWESSFERNLAQWKAIEKANAGANSKPAEPKLRTADDLIETRNEERAYDVVPAAVIDAVLAKLNSYIKELAAKGLHLDEVDSRFPNDLQVIKRNESGLRGTFNRYAKQLNAIARGYKRANEDGFAETEQDLSDWIGVDVKKLREKADRPGAEAVTAPEKSEASNFEEPNLAAAKALIQEAKETHGDKRKEAIVRKKARELAQKTPLSDEKTVLALDMVSTRLGMGDGGTKALEFLLSVDGEQNKPASVSGKAGIDSWRSEFESAKKDGDKAKIQALYDKVRIVLNGIAQSHGDKAVSDFNALKKEIEQHAKSQQESAADEQEAGGDAEKLGDTKSYSEVEQKLINGEINVEDFMSATGLTDDDVGFLTGSDLRQQADVAAKENSPYFSGIRKLSAAIFKEIEGLSRGSTAQSRRAYDANLAKYKAAQDTLEVIAKNFEHPFRNTLLSKLPPFLESRYGKQWDGVEYGDKAKKSYHSDSYSRWVDLLIDAARKKSDAKQINKPDDSKPDQAQDFSKYILISADDISKLRKIDVERVLEQGAVKAFRQSFANWIKAKRPDLAGEVDNVMADIEPSTNEADELKRQRDNLFQKAQVEAQKRHQEEIPSYDQRQTKAGKQRLIQLEQEERRKRQGQIDDIQRKIDRLEGAPAATPAPSSEMDDLKAQMGQAFDELASILGVKKNLTPEEESALLPVMAKIFRIAAKMGMIKFKEAARYVLDALRAHNPDVAEKLSIDNLQSGYVNIAKEIGGNKREALDIDSIEDLYTPDADMVASIEAAEQATNHDATPSQKEAGNYAKGKFAWNGLTISVETAKGEDRTDKETNGDKWRVTMPATYGYIKGTTGADGDQVDVFMGPNPDSGKVYVINQTQVGSEKFDEHKVMLGYQSERAARADYMASFSDGFGRQVYGSLEGPFSVSEFRSMLDDGEFEQKAEIDTGRRLDERLPLSEITVTVEAVEAESGRTVEMDENAADALKDVDDRMKLARSLLECLAS